MALGRKWSGVRDSSESGRTSIGHGRGADVAATEEPASDRVPTSAVVWAGAEPVFLLRLWGGAGVQSAGAVETMAVLELKTPDVRTELAQMWSDAVRGVAKERLPRVTVYTRENLEAMLSSRGLDLGDCEGLCETEIGRKIGARYIISGQVILVEGTYVASVKLHETEKGELLEVEEAEAKSLRGMSKALQSATVNLVAPLRPAFGEKATVAEGVGEAWSPTDELSIPR